MIANRFLTSHQPIWIISNFKVSPVLTFYSLLSPSFFLKFLKIKFLDKREWIIECVWCHTFTYIIKAARNRPFFDVNITFALLGVILSEVSGSRLKRDLKCCTKRISSKKGPTKAWMALRKAALHRDVIMVLLQICFLSLGTHYDHLHWFPKSHFLIVCHLPGGKGRKRGL